MHARLGQDDLMKRCVKFAVAHPRELVPTRAPQEARRDQITDALGRQQAGAIGRTSTAISAAAPTRRG
jgi:hypothetical protein